MNKKGFTLIELIAVLGILSSMFMLTIPTIANTIKEVKLEQYKTIENQIKEAAEIYVQENREMMNVSDEIISLSIEELVKANLLKAPLLDPRDNSDLQEGCVKIKLDNDKVIVYDVLIDAC